MNFLSLTFLIALPLAAVVLPHLSEKHRIPFLLVLSWFLYSFPAPWAFGLLLIETIVTWLCAIGIERKRSKSFVVISLIINFGLLAFFKYDVLHLRIESPAGISFYTFQTLAYVIDVYRGKTEAEEDFITYALFVSFFPQLVAGPIERSSDLLPQLKRPFERTKKDVREGAVLLLRGYILKVMAADLLSVYVDQIYASPKIYGSIALILATICFAFQIYCDFYGYSLIALGAGRLMGVHLSENFDHPYLAENIQQFWRKWHMTLTTWFTDYVYIPLGGNRKGNMRTYLNILIVFALSGLWHGKGLTYLFWGLGHGIWLCLYRMIGNHENEKNDIQSILLTFTGVTILWVLFRADTLKDALCIYQRMLVSWNMSGLESFDLLLFITAIIGMIVSFGLKEKDLDHPYFLFLVLSALLSARLYMLGMYGDSAFIYFSF